MLTCKTAYTEPDTTNKTLNLSTELQLKHGGFVRLNILLAELDYLHYIQLGYQIVISLLSNILIFLFFYSPLDFGKIEAEP